MENCNIDENVAEETNFQMKKYPEEIEDVLYPAHVTNLAYTYDKVVYYTIQMTAEDKVVCLLCPTESHKFSEESIKSHFEGTQHLRNAAKKAKVRTLQFYHIWFTDLQLPYQSHQVYFRPNNKNLRCILCNRIIIFEGIIRHINSVKHKNNVVNVQGSEYKLLDLQLKCYETTENSSLQLSNHQHNVIQSVEETPDNEDIQGFLPHRLIKHKKHLIWNGDSVTCSLCECVLPTDFPIVKKHILNIDHLQKSDIHNVKTYIYFCHICNINFFNEDAWDHHFTPGKNRHHKVSTTCKQEITEYECTSCNMIFFCDNLSLQTHLSVFKVVVSQSEVNFVSEAKRWFPNRQKVDSLGNELVRETKAILDNFPVMNNLLLELQQILSECYGFCKAYPYGSRYSGVCNAKSDLDIFIDYGGMYMGIKSQTKVAQEEFVQKTVEVLQEHADFKDIRTHLNARTPKIKVYSISSKLQCDLSFRHGLGVENTKFVRLCIRIEPIIQPLILVLKEWLLNCQISNNITTYALTMMVIFFMQRLNCLPSVKKLLSLHFSNKLLLDGWETIDFADVSIEKVNKFIVPFRGDLTDLIKEFFSFYSHFDFVNQVVCPFIGLSISREYFETNMTLELPPDMITYKLKVSYSICHELNIDCPFCVQDPLELNNNLTKLVTKLEADKFIELCRVSLSHLEKL